MRAFNWVTGWLGTGPKAPPVLDDIILTERVWEPVLDMDLLPVLDDVILMDLVPDGAAIPTLAVPAPIAAESSDSLEIVPLSGLSNEQFYASGLFHPEHHAQPDWPPFRVEDLD